MYLGDQKVPVVVPRVRNVDHDTEVPLRAYQARQTPRKMDEGLLLRMLKCLVTFTTLTSAANHFVNYLTILSTTSLSRIEEDRFV